MRNRKLLALVCALVISLVTLSAKVSTVSAKPIYDEEHVYNVTLNVGETSERFHPAMRDEFKVYSNTDSSVAEPIFTFENYVTFVSFEAHKPGKTTVRIDGEFFRYRYEITVI